MNFYLVCWLGIILGGTLDMSFYGDTQRWWMGTVEEGSAQSDPTNLGRPRVRIDGIHGPDIPLESLPYAQCILPVTGGGTSGIGENPQLLAGARVTGFFMDGAASQIPCVYGYVPHIAGPTIFQELIAAKEKNKVIVLDNDKTSFINRPRLRPNPNLASDNITLIWNFFTDIRPGQHSNIAHVYQPYHIAAMIGNFIHESGSNRNLTIDTEIFSGVENEVSQGIAQWNEGSGRLAKLRAFALRHGYPHTDLLMQLKFVDHELRTYTYLNDGFFDTTTVEQATMHFLRFYLRPTWCSTGKQKQRSAERINVTSKLNAKTGLFETNTCVYLTREGAGQSEGLPGGNSTVTNLYPFADGGKFPAGSRNFIRSHEHTRVGLAEQINTLYNLTRGP